MGDGRADTQRAWHEWAGRTLEGKSILDVGAGVGLSKSRLGRGGVNRVTTQDVERSLMGKVDVIADLRDVRGRWDVVTAFDVVEHVPDAKSFLGKLAELASESVLFTTPARRLYPHPWHFGPEEVLAMARAIGRPRTLALRHKAGERDEIVTVDELTFQGDERAYALGVIVDVRRLDEDAP
jgi:hypothetical protein